MEVSKEQVREAIEYLDSIEKGQVSMDLSPAVNGGGSENISELKTEMVGLIKKAKEIQDKIKSLEGEKEEAIEKAEEPETVEEEPAKEESKKEEEPELDKEEIIKSIEAKMLSKIQDAEAIIEKYNSKLEGLEAKVQEFENQPIRKSFTSTSINFKDRFEKAQGEGKTLVSKIMQPRVVSNHLANLFDNTTDTIEKSTIGEAIIQFESAGYLSESMQNKLSEKFNLEII